MFYGEIWFLLVLETIGSESNPILFDDDDDDEDGDDNVANGNEDDDSDDNFLYEWRPLKLRQFGMLRSFVHVTGKEYCLFYVFCIDL